MQCFLIFLEPKFYVRSHPWSGFGVFFNSFGSDGSRHAKLDVICDCLDSHIQIAVKNTPVGAAGDPCSFVIVSSNYLLMQLVIGLWHYSAYVHCGNRKTMLWLSEPSGGWT